MGKGLNRERRREKQRRERIAPHAVFIEPKVEHEASTLRLVRSEIKHVSSEPVATGRASEAVPPIREPERSNGFGREEAGGYHVASTIDDGSDDREIVIRSFDAEFINGVYNDPSVFPLVSIPGGSAIDVSPLVADQRNVLLVAEGGGILFVWQEPGVYEAHNAFIEAHRGKYALKATLAACKWMFIHTDCMELLTRVPAINIAAEGLCKLIGATKEFERKAVWKTETGFCDMSFWSLRYDDWIRKTTSLRKSGQEFHRKLEQEYIRLGKKEPLHADEDCHDLHVGACFEMILGGQVDKGVVLYNRWARFSGYVQIALIAHNPTVIDIVESLLQVTGNTFKVILVR